MLKEIASYTGMTAIFMTACLVFNYFISSILKNSTGVWTDIKMWAAFAIPLVFMHTSLIYAWRLGKDVGMSAWAITIFASVCNGIAVTLAMWLFFKETPTWGKIIGMILIITGGIVAKVWG
jgi:drug/metabolite transporter (DMT)-like permease